MSTTSILNQVISTDDMINQNLQCFMYLAHQLILLPSFKVCLSMKLGEEMELFLT